MATIRSSKVRHAVRAALRTPRPRHEVLAGLTALYCATTTITVDAAELPIPCISGTCGSFVERGVASATVSGATLNVDQASDSAVLNWAQFNISSDGVVNFRQPSASAVAVNRIHANDPSRIFGTLNANGRVYLLNRNGVLFGDGASVNVAGLLASTLDITPEAIENGIAGAAARGAPALRQYDEQGVVLPSGPVVVERGARISTADGGQVLMFAPEVVNEGEIRTPGGQTLLAAGSPVYLTTSNDPGLRGLLVEVDVGGDTTNAGRIIAERGNVTLAGLAVNQAGRITATTTVREGGSIRLQARDGAVLTVADGVNLRSNNGGVLTLADASVTEVSLAENPAEVEVDSTAQARSRIELQGRQVNVLENARVSAQGGVIRATARAVPGRTTAILGDAPISGVATDDSRIYIANGAQLDVSGPQVELPMERNVVAAELRGNELANSPAQRQGALRNQTIYVDVRETGVRADGSTWVGTPLADVSGQISLVQRDVKERNLAGGAVTLESQGDVILEAGSTIDVSGGLIQYRDGFIDTTRLLGANGRAYDIADADPDRNYTGILGSFEVEHERWGVTETFTTYAGAGRFEYGYVEGKDAGDVSIVTPRAVVDGDIRGAIATGRYQREAPGAVDSGRLYRPHTEIPVGARLSLGRRPTQGFDQVTANVLLGGGLVLDSLGGPGAPFDPLHQPLPMGFDTTTLRGELFRPGGVSRLDVHANGAVRFEQELALQLPAGGELAIEAGQITVAGQLRAPSGAVRLTALRTETTPTPEVVLEVAASGVLDVSGQWVNDSPVLNAPGSQLGPRLIHGGVVDLSAQQGSLYLRSGSLIDVSSGAWARSDASVVGGDAGSIALTASADVLNPGAATLELGGVLQGFGLSEGGALTINAPAVCITSSGGCGANSLAANPADLLAGGFGALTFQSNERELAVLPGAQIDLQQRNRVLDAGALSIASGADLPSFTTVQSLPDHLRAPVDLSLRTSLPTRPDNPYSNADFADAPGLTIGAGAVIDADPGAAISLRSNSTLVVDGTIRAPSGSIRLTVDNSLTISELLDGQGAWLGSQAHLDASGSVVLTPNEFGLRRGEVTDGGRVEILAQRGAVIANAGSTIDVSGASALLDVGDSFINSTAQQIASDGGVISITAADTVLLSAQMNAAPGAGSANAAGGALQLTLDATARQGGGVQLFLPADERRITVAQNAASISAAPGAPLPDALMGQANVSTSALAQAGFSDVFLGAESTVALDQFGLQIVTPGTVWFDEGAQLTANRQIVLDAARLAGSGDASISAPYVRLGHDDLNYQQTPTGLLSGAGSLQATGQLIELVGHSVLDGFAVVRLESEGDLRLRGVQQTGQQTVQGSLTTSADLTLRADQVYATTLSDFDVSIAGRPQGVLRVEGNADERASVLSAASRLTLSAPTIQQAGVLRAPFGSIELQADDVQLAPGSLTSTAAEGARIPFGSIQAGEYWVYDLTGQTLVVGETTAVPEQRVALNGERVQLDAGAVIDVSAGGDLQAYEFIPGPTGKNDYLNQPGLFAIVPGLDLRYAPYDPQESPGAALAIGDMVHLSAGVAGLPEGDYVLLPASYSLLPGAFLVEAARGYQDLQPGVAMSRLDGATIVSGYRAVAATSIADARTSGFAVRSAAAAAVEARYDTALASRFFAEGAAAAASVAPRLPQDAGVLTITAGAQLDLRGSLRATPGETGRGAAVDVSATNLLISDHGTPMDDQVVVSAEQLSALGAESLLLGGRRSSVDEGTLITVAASEVTIDSDVQLSSPEILLAATDTVVVRSDAALTASGRRPQSDPYLVAGDGAMLRLAAGDQAEIRRSGETGASGSLILDAGARLDAPNGALALDASADTRSSATLALQNGSLSLGASAINVGAAPADAPGLTLDADAINALSLNELTLVSRSSIDLYGDVALAVNDLLLDAAGLRGLQQVQGASISAGERIILANRADQSGVDAAASAASLTLSAGEVVIGDGIQRVSGFGAVTIDAQERVLAQGTGGLSVAGDLTLNSPLMLAGAGARTQIAVSGALALAGEHAAEAVDGALAGDIALSGAALAVANARIQASAGAVTLAASTGDVRLGAGAVIDVAGVARQFDDVSVAAAGGDVRLAAANGSVITEAGALIDLSAVHEGYAGSLIVEAFNGAAQLAGAVNGAANTAERSARIAIDAAQLGDLSAINTSLNAGGVFSGRAFRQRGAGDLIIAGADMRAHRASLTADQGGIAVDGVIDARGVEGGRVLLAARDDVQVRGSILASAGTAEGDGGSVALRSGAGGVLLRPGAVIDVSGGSQGRGGRADIRVTRDVAATVSNGVADDDRIVLGQAIRGSERTRLEAYRLYTDADNILTNGQITAETLSTLDPESIYSHAVAFMTSADAITAGLGFTGDAAFSLLPGIEIQTAADMSLGAPVASTQPATVNWDLSSWRFGPSAAPGVLTLRAAGNLTFNGSLSDGFVGVTGNANSSAFRLTSTDDSWSYRLIAGADAASADPLALNADSAASFTIAPGNPSATQVSNFRMVRTGNGSIDVATAGDFVLGNRTSVLYTAGVANDAGERLGTGNNVGLGGRYYPVDGGNISIRARGDILGAAPDAPASSRVNQLVNDWLWRVGKDPQAPGVSPGSYPTAWTVNFSRFEQNVAALGGGDIEIIAGGDIENFSASIPTIGVPTTASALDSQLQITGGGDLLVSAGGGIGGGSFYVGRGAGVLRAGREIYAAQNEVINQNLYPVLALGDGQWRVTARDSIGIEAIVNPTLLPQATAQGTQTANATTFSTYAPDSSVVIESTGGDVTMSNSTEQFPNWLPTMRWTGDTAGGQSGDAVALRLYAPTLTAASMNGDVYLGGDLKLFPANGSSVQLFAERNVLRLDPALQISLLQSDVDPAFLPSLSAPQDTSAALYEVLASPVGLSSNLHASTPVHAGDDAVSRIVARTGDISFERASGSVSTDGSFLYFSTPVRLRAGRDIIDLPLSVQHDDPNDLSTLTAGRDVRYTIARGPTGAIVGNNFGVDVAGPGTLQLIAGRNIDLQTSAGVTTSGNLYNINLPVAGASMSVLAGVAGATLGYDPMIARYLELGDGYQTDLVGYIEQRTGEENLTDEQAQARFEEFAEYREDLVAFVEQRSGQSGLSEDQALALFREFSREEQRLVLDRVLVSELRYSGSEAAQSENKDYTRGFTALGTLYPGVNPDPEAGETSPYSGDISLFFSRMYTLAGGEIALFAPGGDVNAGLATPPASFGLAKGASDLGIVVRGAGDVSSVTDGDFLVNESRVFTADGGDITIWSSNGDIDAGRGAKTAISAPPATITYGDDGAPIVQFPPALTGSGIQTLATSPGVEKGAAYLFAPRGVVNAGDAGIAAGDLIISATAVLGADNISVSGVAIGVPVDAGGLGAALSSVSNVASSATSAATASIDAQAGDADQSTPLAETALSWLDVFVIGLGEDACDPKDVECLKRQSSAN